ncbi:hypothetical protein H6P81_007603 [Aristolochia fimbriata]|uniref:DUF547 domain-containing protein n=1 Tax=Aristolochia fimbriata TaxID=158543 RepID=A0AAV7F1V4_ARIFI|nr:hypothetical protein H6P81_007603 [Aristolochia fimbriata]
MMFMGFTSPLLRCTLFRDFGCIHVTYRPEFLLTNGTPPAPADMLTTSSFILLFLIFFPPFPLLCSAALTARIRCFRVAELRGVLDMEQEMRRVLRRALHSPQDAYSCRSSLIPIQIRLLLGEVAMIEEEIIRLERKLQELKWCLQEERRQSRFDQPYFLSGLRTRRNALRDFAPSPAFQHGDISRQRLNSSERDPFVASTSEVRRWHSMKLNGYARTETWGNRSVARNEQNGNQKLPNAVKRINDPNKLSEELMKCLITIFLKLNQTAHESSTAALKLAIPCMNSKGFITKTSLPCKPWMSTSEENRSRLDPYGILSDAECITRDVGAYRDFIHFTTNTLDTIAISQCVPEMGKIRVLMHKLCYVDLSPLTYKHKLAFWINIYNASIMHAFLQHGLPSTGDKLLALMNKAAVNVGGIILNSLAIEHFILRHTSNFPNSGKERADERETLLQYTYGLNYPEPDIIFALCRGSRSSPALRVYTAQGVVHELEKAKLEYLEASIGVTCKKTIIVPKLLHWHMQDFADNDESLLEWIYSQLPRTGSLKRLIMECLNSDNKFSITKKIEVMPYESEFRYLLSL